MHEAVAALRTRAELARRLSSEIKEPRAAAALREIAEALDAEADCTRARPTPSAREKRHSRGNNAARPTGCRSRRNVVIWHAP